MPAILPTSWISILIIGFSAEMSILIVGDVFSKSAISMYFSYNSVSSIDIKNEFTSPLIKVWHKVSAAVNSPMYFPSLRTASPILSVPRSPRMGTLPETISSIDVILLGLSSGVFSDLLCSWSPDEFSDLSLEDLSEDAFEFWVSVELADEILGFNPPKIARFPHSLVVK